MIRYLGRKILQALEVAEKAAPASGRIVEPFAGSAAFSRIFGEKGLVNKAVIGDTGPRIINLQQQVAENPGRLLDKFTELVKPLNRGYTKPEDIPYLKELWNQAKVASPRDKAAMDLVTGNYSRRFNPESGIPSFTPGKYATPEGIGRKVLSLSKLTSKGEVLNAPFEETLSKVKSGDFVVLDPPYPQSRKYNKNADYEDIYSRLNEIIEDIKNRTSGVIYTNKVGSTAFPGIRFKPRERTSYMDEIFATWGKDWKKD